MDNPPDIAGYLCELPVDEPGPPARLHTVQQVMQCNKAAGPARGPGAFPLIADELHDTAQPTSTPDLTPLSPASAPHGHNPARIPVTRS